MTRAGSSASDHRRLLDNVASMGVLQAANYLLPLLTVPYLARVLGPERFGLVAFAQATIQYFVVVTDFGFNLSATREISVRQQDPGGLAETFSAVMTLKALLATASGLALVGLVLAVPDFRSEWRLFAAAFGMVIGSVLFPIWFFQGLERMRFIAGLSVVARAIFTGLVFLLVKTPEDYFAVPALNAVGSLTAGVLGIAIAVRTFGVRFSSPSRADLLRHLRASAPYFASRVSLSLYTASNVFVLGLVGSPLGVGLYSAAEKIYGAMQGVYSPVTSALYPHMARTKDRRLFKRIVSVALPINTVGCLLLILFAEHVMDLAFGPQYSEGATPLRLLSLAMIFLLPTYLLGFPFLAALGQARYANGSVIGGSLLHIAGLALLLLLGGMHPTTVAGMVALTEATVLALRVWAIHRTSLWNGSGDAAAEIPREQAVSR